MRARRGSFYISNGDTEKRMSEISKRKILIPISRTIYKIEEENEEEDEDERKINDIKQESTVTETESINDIHIVAMMVEEELENIKDAGKIDNIADTDIFNDFESTQERIFVNETENNNVAVRGFMTNDDLFTGLSVSYASASGDTFK